MHSSYSSILVKPLFVGIKEKNEIKFSSRIFLIFGFFFRILLRIFCNRNSNWNFVSIQWPKAKNTLIFHYLKRIWTKVKRLNEKKKQCYVPYLIYRCFIQSFFSHSMTLLKLKIRKDKKMKKKLCSFVSSSKTVVMYSMNTHKYKCKTRENDA